MGSAIIQVKYDAVEKIAARFGREAEQVEEMNGRVQRAIQPLQDGGWAGEGSAAFFAEMEQDIFPAVHRLSNALTEAQRVTLEICTIMRQAEEDASAPFRSNPIDEPVPNKEAGGDGAGSAANKSPGLWDRILSVSDSIVDAIDQIDDIAPIPAAMILASMLKAGLTYGGQTLVYGPKWLKDLAGVSSNLTHIKASNMAAHITKRAVVFSALIATAQGVVGVAKTWTEHWDEYKSYNDTSKQVSAMTVDAGLALLPVAAETLGGIGGTIGGAKLGAVVGTFIGGPGLGTAAGAIIGGAVGGFAGDWIGGAAGNWAKDGIISAGGREWATNTFDKHVAQPVADGISYMADKIRDFELPSFSLPRMNFSF